MMKEVKNSMEEAGIELEITEAAKLKLAQLGYNPAFGACPLRRAIQEFLEDGIADLIMDEGEVKIIKVDCIEDQISIRKA